jgi:hypothetical protein
MYLGRLSGEDACYIPFEEYVEADDSLLYAVQKIVLKTRIQKLVLRKREAAVCKLIPKCSEAIQCFGMYHHFLRGVSDVPERIIRNWKLENSTSNFLKDK